MKAGVKLVFAHGWVLLVAIVLLSAGAMSQDSLPAAGVLPGQSDTLLPDGTHLLLGGQISGGPTRSAAFLDPATGNVMPLATHLNIGRAWHTASILPDGSVAVIGGASTAAKAIATNERFDTSTEAFAFSANGITPRAHHTATLLTDGTVLIIGGVSADGKTLGSAQIWNPVTNQVSNVASGLQTPRSGHAATVQPDGNVLIEGGVDANGNAVGSTETYNSQLQQFEPASTDQEATNSSAGSSTSSAPGVAGWIPANGATGVPTGVVVSLRFSEPMEVVTVNANTVTLSAPGGSISATVVPAEGGMLAFLTPKAPLAPSTTYTVTVSGVVDANGVEIPTATVSFTTASTSIGLGLSSLVATGGPSGNEFNSAGVWIPTSDWYTHLPASRWQSLAPLRAAQGVTALSGQVLTMDGSPLANVTFQVGSYSARSDGTGRFLITGLPAGKGTLLIDGTSANNGGRSYGIFQPGVSVTAKVTNVLPFTIWMPVLDVAHAITVKSPTRQETMVSNPLMPGLDLRIPAGTVITDIHGKVARVLTMTPVPLDRPPFPLPADVKVPIYFTIQPGGAQLWTTSGKWALARLIYPNLTHAAPNSNFVFWNYDPKAGWYDYGNGRVTQDGKQIVPNPGVGIWQFSGAMASALDIRTQTDSCQSGPAGGPDPNDTGADSASDPVDCGNGVFIHSESDFHLPDVIPIDFTRTYLSQDNHSWPFGIGTSDSYEIYITGDKSPYTYMKVVLPDGQQIDYTNTNTSDPDDWTVTYYVPTLSPSSFYYGSNITWNGNGWTLRLKNGTNYIFPESCCVSNPAQAALIGITDRNGNTVTISRDSSGNITQITSPNGRWIQFENDSSNRITQATDNIGRTVTYTYNSYSATGRPSCSSTGLLCAVTDANGGVTSYTYDSGNRMLTVTDPRGNTQITNTYDSTNDRVTSQTLADGTSEWQYSYTVSGGAVTQTDVTNPNGNVETKAFDSNSFVTSDTYAYGVSGVAQTFSYTRDSSTELPTSVTDQLGRETTYAYDSSGNITSITRLAGTSGAVTTSLTYDSTFNQVTSVTDPLSHTWSMTYDSNGNLTQISDPLSHTVTLTYDSQGRPLSVADAASDTAQFAYLGPDLQSITDPLGNITNRFTDNAGRLLSVTNALGQRSILAWDVLDRLIGVTDPNGNSTSLAYDANGNLLSVTDANSNETSYTYDSRNRRIARTDALSVSETYQYDANGNLTQVTDRRGKVTVYQYDALNRRTFAGFGNTGSTYESTITNTFDAGNRLTQAVDSIAGTISRTYDGLNRLIEEETPLGTVDYTYDSGGRRASMTVAGQTAVDYTWDNANRLTGISQGSASVGVSYDSSNRHTQLTLPNGVTVAYSYDTDSRVTGLSYSPGTASLGNLTYSYDPAGRVIGKGGSLAATGMPSAVSGNTFNADNGMSAFNGTTLTYDANGNLTNDGTNTYTWDARSHLTAMSGGTSASFVYDAFGRRMKKTVGGTTTQFVYDGMNPVQELDGASTPSVTANLLTGLGIDEYFTRADSSGAMNFLTDALGSAIAVADSSGSINTSYTYEPFGNVTVTGSNGNPYQFTGRDNDATGLYFYRARYYSPTSQRFIAQDPIGFRGGPNLYAYTGNAPTFLTDPGGEWTASLGFSFGYQFGWGINGTATLALVVDTQGNMGIAITGAGPGGTGVGGTWVGGAYVGVSNAPCIRDLKGPFFDVSASGGEGLGGGVNVFHGSSPDGPVTGGGVTIGGAVGGGVTVSGPVSGTIIIPLN